MLPHTINRGSLLGAVALTLILIVRIYAGVVSGGYVVALLAGFVLYLWLGVYIPLRTQIPYYTELWAVLFLVIGIYGIITNQFSVLFNIILILGGFLRISAIVYDMLQPQVSGRTM